MSADLETRVTNLEGFIDTQVNPQFKDMQDLLDSFARRIEDKHREVLAKFVAINKILIEQLAELEIQRAELQELVKKGTAQITAEHVAKALTKTVIPTRPATREELRDGTGVMATRTATRQEIEQSLAGKAFN